ncbi:unnamed protein product [Ectocarpus sp. 8 AP-2014]
MAENKNGKNLSDPLQGWRFTNKHTPHPWCLYVCTAQSGRTNLKPLNPKEGTILTRPSPPPTKMARGECESIIFGIDRCHRSALTPTPRPPDGWPLEKKIGRFTRKSTQKRDQDSYLFLFFATHTWRMAVY